MRAYLGTIDQSSEQFQPFNGTQCTAMALAGLAALHIKTISCTTFNDSRLIDDVLHTGNNLYVQIIHKSNGNLSGALHHDDLPTSITLYNYNFNLEYCIGCFAGIIDYTIHESMYNTFTQIGLISNYIISTFNEVTVALYINFTDNEICLFDSHKKNAHGNVDAFGKAGLFVFERIEELIIYILNTYHGKLYEFTPVIITNSQAHSINSPNEDVSPQIATSPPLQNQDHSYYKSHRTLPKECSSITTGNRKRLLSNEASTSKAYNNKPCKEKSPVKKRKNNNSHKVEMFDDNNDTGNIKQKHSSVDEDEAITEKFVNHNMGYENMIRELPKFSCISCERFLFENQVKQLKKDINLINEVRYVANDTFCQTCYLKIQKGSIPNISAIHNGIQVETIPDVLQQLSITEKKMISLIQVFMTLVILPGGQYAEKGLILNLPGQDALDEMLKQLCDFDKCDIIHVEYTNGKETSYKPKNISKTKIINCLQWLSENNHLYKHLNISKIILPDIENEVIDENMLEQATVIPCDHVSSGCKVSSFLAPQMQTLQVPSLSSHPVNVFELEHGEEMAYPWLFPKGKFGLRYDRPLKINPSMYFRCRIYHKSGTFRKDIKYLLHTAVSYDMYMLKQEIGIFMKMRRQQNTNIVSLGDLKNEEMNPTLWQNSYMFMRNIRGTVAYFKNALYDLLAMFRSLGPPSIFMTLSADDCHWPELGMALENISYEEASKRKSFAESMRKDPLLAAIHFDRRFKALMKYIINGRDSVFPKVKDYFTRIEFQNRGSIHQHMFLWLEDFPTNITLDNEQNVITLIDNLVCTDLPDKHHDPELYELVTKLQTHNHSSYCSRSSGCRFGFPKPPVSKTYLRNNNTCFNSKKGRFYESKRGPDATHINSYNKDILRHWRANMDIQIVNNAVGAAYYICAYLCKSEQQLLQNALADRINNIFKEKPELTTYQRLLHIGRCVLNHRQMSAQEAAYKPSNLELVTSSRRIMRLNTQLPEKRILTSTVDPV